MLDDLSHNVPINGCFCLSDRTEAFDVFGPSLMDIRLPLAYWRKRRDVKNVSLSYDYSLSDTEHLIGRDAVKLTNPTDCCAISGSQTT